ncbi:Adenosylcobinamide-GDP ribazoletransferase [Thalassocella blandensis]|nr:Adenosylcobinamide-GDP ribazoletransferase [Thalassocella blandensis]
MSLKAFLLALTLLTRIPLPSRLSCILYDDADWSDVDRARAIRNLSSQFYPLIGIILGFIVMLVVLLGIAIPDLSIDIQAFIVLAMWVALSGALHLDGLADCTDALFASHRNPQDMLRVMREPTVGAMAVVVLCLTLLGKFILIRDVIQQELLVPFILAPCLARLGALVYMRLTPYVGSGLANDLTHPRFDGVLVLQLVMLTGCIVVLYSLLFALACAMVLAILLWWWRAKWLNVVGGFTGDCVGALIELSELLLLAAMLSCAL